MATVDICLATFNGAPWLRSLLDSLEQQQLHDWRLIVSDDFSKDETLNILRSYFTERPDKVLFVSKARTEADVIRNFQDALAASTADYIFLADQDDVWLPHKLGELLTTIRVVEGAPAKPALVYSDMLVVNANLAPMSDSWWAYSGIDARWATSLRGLLTQNAVPGCSMVVNRRLLALALPIPPDALMHDWWLILVAQALGRTGCVPQVTMLYRRHQAAVTYFDRRGWSAAASIRSFLLQRKQVRDEFKATAKQSRCLLERSQFLLSEDQRTLIEDYARAGMSGWWRRRWLMLRHRIRKPSLKATIKMYFWI